MLDKVKLAVIELVVLKLAVLEPALKIVYLLAFLKLQAFGLLNQIIIKSFYD